MESLKVTSMLKLLEDGDFDVPTLLKIQSTISDLVAKKYHVFLQDFYQSKLAAYAAKQGNDGVTLLQLLSAANFVRRRDCLLQVEHGLRTFTIDRFKDHKLLFRRLGASPLAVRIDPTVETSFEISSQGSDDNIGSPHLKPFVDFAKFLLTFEDELLLIKELHDFS